MHRPFRVGSVHAVGPLQSHRLCWANVQLYMCIYESFISEKKSARAILSIDIMENQPVQIQP